MKKISKHIFLVALASRLMVKVSSIAGHRQNSLKNTPMMNSPEPSKISCLRQKKLKSKNLPKVKSLFQDLKLIKSCFTGIVANLLEMSSPSLPVGLRLKYKKL